MAINERLARGLVLLGMFAMLLVGCSGGTHTPDASARKTEVGSSADTLAVKALLDEWVRLYNAGAYEALVAAFYAEDACLLSPYGPPRHGREAILASLVADAAVNEEHCNTSVVEDMRVSGDLVAALGSDTGTTTPKQGGTPESYILRWVMVFQRQADDSWKCIYEIWNEDNAAGE